ncbi:hypothetical protein D3C72_1207540 [compost metagenome]
MQPYIGTSICVPAPPARTRDSALATAKAAYSPEAKSASGTPHLTGSPSGSPVTLITPAAAWMVRSKPPSAARGPLCPYAEIEQYTRPGLCSRMLAKPRPSLSMTPGRLFSTTTSASRISRRASAASPASFRLRVTDCLFRFSEAKFSENPLEIGGHWRSVSPSGDSTLITSAPMSASSMPQNGPAATVQNSTTLTPFSGRSFSLRSSIALPWDEVAGPKDFEALCMPAPVSPALEPSVLTSQNRVQQFLI